MSTPGSPPSAPAPGAPTSVPPLDTTLTNKDNIDFFTAPSFTTSTTTATEANGKTPSSTPLSPTTLEVKSPTKDASEPIPAPPTPITATKPTLTSPITPSQPMVTITNVEIISSVSSITSASPTSATIATPTSTVAAVNGSSNGTVQPEDMEGITETLSPVEPEAPAGPSGEAQDGRLSALEEQLKAQAEELEKYKRDNQRLYIELEDSNQDLASLKDERERNHGAYNDLSRQYYDLQTKLIKKEQEYDTMSKNYLEHVRMIRATDDDHSTIMDRLNQLKASIEHLVRKAQGSRSVNLNKDAVIEHFKASGLLENFPVSEEKLEPYQLNLYMESVIMSTLVSHFFDKSLSCIFEYNKGFKEIYDWMHHRNNKLAVRWRQQLCVMIIQDPVTKARQEEEVNTASTALTELVSNVYANSNEAAKLRDICNKAFELAIAMNAMDNVISPVTVPLGSDFDDDEMGTSLKSNPEGKVALVIFPAFKDQVSAFNVRPKVWCY
ncbi:hypothetical protein BG005_011312 [Podila minutissima]|nr:hypothetical protein BG005_011312 [Podila minutissima]